MMFKKYHLCVKKNPKQLIDNKHHHYGARATFLWYIGVMYSLHMIIYFTNHCQKGKDLGLKQHNPFLHFCLGKRFHVTCLV